MEIIGYLIAAAIVGLFGYVFYRRVIKGESADFNKRDENGKIVK